MISTAARSKAVTLAAVYSKAVVLFFVAVDSLLIVAPIVRFCNCSMFCCALLVPILVFQSSRRGRENWLLCFVCLPGVS